jgi:uncharacterized membrane protein
MTLETRKNLGGIGAILMFVGALPYISTYGIVELIGVILVLVALHGLANFYADRSIFNNAIYGIIAGIVGVIVAAAVAVFSVLTQLVPFLQTIYPDWNGTDWTALQGMTPDTSNLNPADVLPFIAGILVVIVVVWIFSIIAAFFIRRSLKTLSVRSNVGLFGTAGLLLLIGAVLVIIFGLGLLLIWISALILAIAFFTMKAPEQYAPTATAPPPPTSV